MAASSNVSVNLSEMCEKLKLLKNVNVASLSDSAVKYYAWMRAEFAFASDDSVVKPCVPQLKPPFDRKLV